MKDLPHIVEESKDKIVKFILEFDKICEGDYGVYFETLKRELKITEPVLRDSLNELVRERKLNHKNHYSGKLVFLNYENPDIKKLQDGTNS